MFIRVGAFPSNLAYTTGKGLIMTDTSAPPDQTPPPSRDKDSRDIVTAYAFEVDKQLLGKPISRPWRRAVAQGTDLLFIAILSQLPSLLLALLTSFAFLRASRRNNHNIQSTTAKRLLKLAGTGLLFITTVIIAEAIRSNEPSGESENPVAQAVVYGLHTVARNQCNGDFECLTGVADGSGEAFAEAGVRRDDAEDHFNDFSDEPTLSDGNRQSYWPGIWPHLIRLQLFRPPLLKPHPTSCQTPLQKLQTRHRQPRSQRATVTALT